MMPKHIFSLMMLALLAGCASPEPAVVEEKVPENSAFTGEFIAALENPEALAALRKSCVKETPPSTGTLHIERKYEGETGELSMCLFSPAGTGEARRAVLFLPENYYVLDNRTAAYAFCAALAAEAECVVALPAFRLAPENKYPAALDDILAAYNFLVTRADEFGVDPEKICLAGEGTGGELALSALFREFENTGELPAGILLFNPLVTRRKPENEFSKGYSLDATLLGAALNAYAAPQEAPPDYAILPPALIIIAEKDLLRNQGEVLAGKLKTTGKRVKSLRFKGAEHNFLTASGMERYRKRAVTEAATFLNSL